MVNVRARQDMSETGHGNSTASPLCRREHAALARTYLDWHAQRATLVRTVCLAVTASLPTTGVSNANPPMTDPAQAPRQWAKGHGVGGADDCASWGAPFALRSATAALSAMRTQAHVARMRDQIALALLAAPTGGALLSPRAMRLIDSPELLSLLRHCVKAGLGGPGAAGLAGASEAGGGKGGGAHAGLARTPLARMLSRQRRYLVAQPSKASAPTKQGAAVSGLAASPLSASTRLGLPGGGQMPLVGLGTNYADCCCGGREWLGTDVLWGGVVRARLSPGASPACTSLPPADFYSRALAQGVRMIETGASYGTEVAVGQGVRESGVAREAIFVISKAWPADRLRSPHTRAAIGASAISLQPRLRAMGLQALDLYLSADASVDASAAETLDGGLPGQGGEGTGGLEASAWGATAPLTAEEWAASVASAKAARLAAAVGTAGEAVPGSQVAQVRLSPCAIGAPFATTPGAVPLSSLASAGVVLVAAQPVGDPCVDDAVVRAIAGERRISPQQVLSRWSVQLGVPLVVHTANLSHIADATDVFRFELSPSEMETLESVALLYTGDCSPSATRAADVFHLRPTWPCLTPAPPPPAPPTPLARSVALLLGPPPPGMRGATMGLLAVFIGGACSAFAPWELLGTVLCGVVSGAAVRLGTVLSNMWLASADYYVDDEDLWVIEL